MYLNSRLTPENILLDSSDLKERIRTFSRCMYQQYAGTPKAEARHSEEIEFLPQSCP
jgi:hypothetical protein